VCVCTSVVCICKYMYLFTYVCVYVQMLISAYHNMCICANVHICVCTYVQICKCSNVRKCICTRTYVSVYEFICMCQSVYVYVYMCVYILKHFLYFRMSGIPANYFKYGLAAGLGLAAYAEFDTLDLIYNTLGRDLMSIYRFASLFRFI
jgi:hypothetical protein